MQVILHIFEYRMKYFSTSHRISILLAVLDFKNVNHWMQRKRSGKYILNAVKTAFGFGFGVFFPSVNLYAVVVPFFFGWSRATYLSDSLNTYRVFGLGDG